MKSLRYLELASHVAQWSKDPSTKVGAVLIGPDDCPISFGYNGFPKGADDSEENLSNRQVKYSMTIHAETNVILAAKKDLTGATMYVTHPPCLHCLSMIRQSGIYKVVSYMPSEDFLSRWPLKPVEELANKLGIDLEIIDD